MWIDTWEDNKAAVREQNSHKGFLADFEHQHAINSSYEVVVR